MTDPANQYQAAYTAVNAAHDNVVQLYTLLDVLHRRPDCQATPEQTAYLHHNLINLEDHVNDLRTAFVALGIVSAAAVTEIIDGAIWLGRQAEKVNHTWQRNGHPPRVQLVEVHGQIAAMLDPDTPKPKAP